MICWPGSQLLSFIEQTLSPTEKQLEKLEEEDKFPGEDPTKDCDADEASVLVEDTTQEQGITINGEVVRIRTAHVCLDDFKGHKT